MGKNLKGKEIGKGISQRDDGDYCARVTDATGKRHQKRFRTLTEAREWMATVDFDSILGCRNYDNMTMDSWFDIWLNEIKKDTILCTTYSRLKVEYNTHIRDVLGHMKVKSVRRLDCQRIVSNMIDKGNKASTIEMVIGELKTLLSDAVSNNIAFKNPCDGIKLPQKDTVERRVLTIDEQRKFIEYLAEHPSKYSNMFMLMLETGLRVGEALGLQWSDVDFENRVLHIQHNVVRNKITKELEIHNPKTNAGKRKIPLTENAIKILKKTKANRPLVITQWTNHVFADKKGEIHQSNATTSIMYAISDNMGVPHFTCHTLRHTFATRCIEAGMKPKTLQKILGHSDISVTMNLYVHVTNDEIVNEMKKFELYAI